MKNLVLKLPKSLKYFDLKKTKVEASYRHYFQYLFYTGTIKKQTA